MKTFCSVTCQDLFAKIPFRASRVRHQVGSAFTVYKRKVWISKSQCKSKSSLLNRILQWSGNGCKVNLQAQKRSSCDSENHPLEFVPSWLFCVLSGLAPLKGSHAGRPGHINRWRSKAGHGARLSGSGPKGCEKHPVSPNHHYTQEV